MKTEDEQESSKLTSRYEKEEKFENNMSEQARREIENHMEDLKSYHSNYKDTRIEQIYSEIKDKLEAISRIK